MLVYLVALLAFLSIAGIGFVFAGGDEGAQKATKRAQALTGGSGKVDKAKNRTVDQAGTRRKQILQTLKDQEKQSRKAKLTIASRMKQAGLVPNMLRFWGASGALAVVGLLITVVLQAHPLVILGAALIFGLGLPRWVLGFLGGRRIKSFTAEFANAIDIIVRGIKSGLPVNDCLKVIGQESPEPLAGEFRRLVEGASMGQSIDEGLNRMLESMPTAEVRFFAITIGIQQKSGGNLAEALGNLSTVLRARKLMGEKIKAMSGEAVASACIIGSLPIVVMALVSFVSPAYMVPMFTDDRGKMLLMIAVVTMATGVFVMKKMINFKF